MLKANRELEERELEDEYPVYFGYNYVADGSVINSPIQGKVRDLKKFLKVESIKNCDIFGRRERGERIYLV